jgi:hypothetical protein
MAGLCTLLMRPARFLGSAIVVKPSTLRDFDCALKKREYRLLFSLKLRSKPGPKGATKELVTLTQSQCRSLPTQAD